EAGELARGRELEPRHVGQIVTRDDAGNTVRVPRHDMAAQLVADLQRPLEIELRPDGPVPGRGHTQGLGSGIDVEPGLLSGALAALDAGCHYRQADAVAGDGSAVGNR